MSTPIFSPEQVKELSQQYDLFDMEAYAVVQFCKMYDIPFYCAPFFPISVSSSRSY